MGLWSECVQGLGENLRRYGLLVSLLDAAELVVADGVEFLVPDGGGFGLEVVEGDRLIGIGDGGDIQRVGGVIDQHLRVTAQLNEVDGVILHIFIVGADELEPPDILEGFAQGFDHYPRPYLLHHPSTSRARGKEGVDDQGNERQGHSTYPGRDAEEVSQERTDEGIERERSYQE